MDREGIAKFFDQVYGDGGHFFGSKVRPEFTAWCERNAVAGLRALDAGCGDGRYSLYLAERGAVVTGVDFSRVGLANLRRMADEGNLQVETILADLCGDPLPAGPFDLIVIDTVLGHLTAACAERLSAVLCRALAPCGVLYASVFTVEDPGYAAAGADRASELSPTAVHYFSAGELRALFAALEEVSYREFVEESRAHGDPHLHGYAVGFFRKA
jgi:SAM-dependent methyltransferase